MRFIQGIFFFVGFAAFLAAMFFVGADTGDVLWRVGVAALLLDIVCIMLWPARSRDNETAGS